MTATTPSTSGPVAKGRRMAQNNSSKPFSVPQSNAKSWEDTALGPQLFQLRKSAESA